VLFIYFLLFIFNANLFKTLNNRNIFTLLS